MRFIIAAFELGADPGFFDKLHGGQKQVLQDSQFVLVKIIHGYLSGLRVVAQVAKDFAYMGPIFLFDVSVVVLFVGAAAGELNGLLITEGLEVVVDELTAIVGIDA